MTRRRAFFYIAFFLLATLVLLFVHYNRLKIGKILSPFLMAVVIAYLLHPLAVRLEKRNIPRKIGILLIYLVLLGFIVSTGVFIVPELINNTRDLMTTLPEIISDYQGMFNHMVSAIRSSKWSGDIQEVLFREIQNAGNTAQAYVADTLKGSLNMLIEAVTTLFDFFLALVIAYYFLKDTEFFKSIALSLVPRKWRSGIIDTGREINGILSNFIQGQLLTAVIVGVLEVIGLMIVGIKYSLVLGVVGGLANVIPYFGPVIGAVPAVAVALLQSPLKAALTAVVFIIVQQLDNSYISPKIIEGRLGLHPVTTILAVLIGGEFFGILGMLVSVPAAAILRVILKRAVEAIV